MPMMVWLCHYIRKIMAENIDYIINQINNIKNRGSGYINRNTSDAVDVIQTLSFQINNLIKNSTSKNGRNQRIIKLIPHLKGILNIVDTNQRQQVSTLINKIRSSPKKVETQSHNKKYFNQTSKDIDISRRIRFENGKIIQTPSHTIYRTNNPKMIDKMVETRNTPGAINTTPGIVDNRCPEGYSSVAGSPYIYCSADIQFLNDLIDANNWKEWVGWRLNALDVGTQTWYEGRLLELTAIRGLHDPTYCTNYPENDNCQEEGYQHYWPIKEVPESIGNLNHLRWLGFQRNEIEYLPETFGQLRELTEFNCKHNLLSKLPESIGEFRNLWSLSFHDNVLEEIPRTLCDIEFQNWHDDYISGAWDPPVLYLDENNLCPVYQYECLNEVFQLWWDNQDC